MNGVLKSCFSVAVLLLALCGIEGRAEDIQGTQAEEMHRLYMSGNRCFLVKTVDHPMQQVSSGKPGFAYYNKTAGEYRIQAQCYQYSPKEQSQTFRFDPKSPVGREMLDLALRYEGRPDFVVSVIASPMLPLPENGTGESVLDVSAVLISANIPERRVSLSGLEGISVNGDLNRPHRFEYALFASGSVFMFDSSSESMSFGYGSPGACSYGSMIAYFPEFSPIETEEAARRMAVYVQLPDMLSNWRERTVSWNEPMVMEHLGEFRLDRCLHNATGSLQVNQVRFVQSE